MPNLGSSSCAECDARKRIERRSYVLEIWITVQIQFLQTALFETDSFQRWQVPNHHMGVPCEHLAFSQNNIDWQVWIENGARPVPRKFVITYKDEPDSPEFTAIFSNWDFTTQLPDFVFKFDPPPGSAKIGVKELREENQSHKTEKQSK